AAEGAGCTPVSCAQRIASAPGWSAGTSGKRADGLPSPGPALPEEATDGASGPSVRSRAPVRTAPPTAAAAPPSSTARRPARGGDARRGETDTARAAGGDAGAASTRAASTGAGTTGAAAGAGAGAPGRPGRRCGAAGRLTATSAPASDAR